MSNTATHRAPPELHGAPLTHLSVLRAGAFGAALATSGNVLLYTVARLGGVDFVPFRISLLNVAAGSLVPAVIGGCLLALLRKCVFRAS